MLHELTIENFALLAHVHIRFGAGLNVLTGETGAGKSIIIDAISRVLGSRGGADDVRSGATHAHIEAVFSLAEPPAALHALLAERGLLDADDDGQTPDTGPLDLILTRDIRPNGRSVGRVNGRAVPLHTVAALGRFLLDIHGQTEHLSLLQPATQLQLLDRFGGLEALGAEVRDTAAALGDARRQWQRDAARRARAGAPRRPAPLPGRRDRQRRRTALARTRRCSRSATCCSTPSSLPAPRPAPTRSSPAPRARPGRWINWGTPPGSSTR